MVLFVRTTRKCPTTKQDKKPDEVNFKAVIMFFDADDDKQVVFPSEVVEKLNTYAFCLFDHEEVEE